MITLYETKRGDYVLAKSLTKKEAVRAYERGWLLAADLLELKPKALSAVKRVFKAKTGFELRIERGSIWGRKAGDKRPVIVVEGVQ